MIVCKFGGSATANKQAVENVKKLFSNQRVVWVFSAIGKSNKNDIKTTDLLINYTKHNSNKTKIMQQLITKFKKLCLKTNVDMNITAYINSICKKFENDGDKNWFISRGEYLTTQIMAKYLNLKFVPAEKIIFLKNNIIDFAKTEKSIKKLVLSYKNIAVPGFYAANQIDNDDSEIEPQIKLFSRGGSDYSACILAKCLGASICENWTDVDGIYPINPNLKKSNILQNLSYTDLNIMSKMDANVIHKNCASLLNGTGTILQVKNIFKIENAGTTVSSTYTQRAEFVAFKKGKDNCTIIQKLKNGGSITLKLPSGKFKNGVEFLQKVKKQL